MLPNRLPRPLLRTLVALLLTFAAAPASAQPFWPDPDDAYPYEPQDARESLDYANASFTVRIPALAIPMTVTPIAQTPTIAQWQSRSGPTPIPPNSAHFVLAPEDDGTVAGYDVVYQTTRNAEDVPSRTSLRLQATDATGRVVGERNVFATRQRSAGTTQRHQAPATRRRCPESDGYLSCTDEASPLVQAVVRSATTALPLTGWSIQPAPPSFEAPDWQPSYEDDWNAPRYDYDD